MAAERVPLDGRAAAVAEGTAEAPVWRGQDLEGKSILIRPEQGLGDTLLFVRYAPLIKALGAKVLLQSWRGLGGIDAGIPGVDVVIRRESRCRHSTIGSS